MKRLIHYWIDKMYLFKHLKLTNRRNRKKSRGMIKTKLFKIIKNRERLKLRCAISVDTQGLLQTRTSI